MFDYQSDEPDLWELFWSDLSLLNDARGNRYLVKNWNGLGFFDLEQQRFVVLFKDAHAPVLYVSPV